MGLCVAAASADLLRATSQQAAPPELDVRISTPTYFATGKVGGASASGWNLALNTPLVAYAYSGGSLCESASAVPDLPSDAGFGWRIQITPLRQEGGLLAQVDWQRIWERGVKVDGGQKGRAQIMLQPGTPVMLDYLSAGDSQASAFLPAQISEAKARLDFVQKSGQRPDDVKTLQNLMAALQRKLDATCQAIGMGLQISVESKKTPAIVETDLWLVYSRPDKPEQSQHQTLRVRAGDSAMYWFDDVAVLLPAAPVAAPDGRTASQLAFWKSVLAERLRQGMTADHPDVKEAKRQIQDAQEKYDKEQATGALKPLHVVEVPIQVSGRLEPIDRADRKIHAKLTIARSSQGAPHGIGGVRASSIAIEPPPTGSTTYDVTAEPGEVLSFQLPAIRGSAGYTAAGTLSVRFRARILTSIPTTTTTTTPITLNQR
jgi:hypothetical protein